MLEEVLVLLNKLLTSQPTILIEQVDFKDLLFVFSISRAEQSCNNEWEKVPECSVPNVLGENVVVVRVEKLYKWRITNREPIPKAYWKYLCLSMTGKGMRSSHSAELIKIGTV